jgi:hypothetical protein
LQAKKAKLRDEARLRLDDIMQRKNKRSEQVYLLLSLSAICRCIDGPRMHQPGLPLLRLPCLRTLNPTARPPAPAVVWELDDDDDWSVASSELSAWDSDVDSVSSLVSCAEDWKAQHRFPARAEAALKYASCASLVGGRALAQLAGGLLVPAAQCRSCRTAKQHLLPDSPRPAPSPPSPSPHTKVVATSCMRVAWLSYSGFKQFWGVLDYKWSSLGTAAVSSLAALCAALALLAWAGKSKRLLLAMQLAAHLVFASALAMGMCALSFPAQVNEQVGGPDLCPQQQQHPCRLWHPPRARGLLAACCSCSVAHIQPPALCVHLSPLLEAWLLL